MNRILVVDDDPQIRFFLDQALRDEDYDLTICPDAETALKQMTTSQRYDLVLMDVRLPKMNGLDALREIKRTDPRALVIVMTAYSSKDTAMEALRRGAHDYFNKPFKVDELRTVVRRALEKAKLIRDAEEAGPAPVDRDSFGPLVGQSEPFMNMLRRIERVAKVDSTVLIVGESGTGKELVAQAIHDHSPRKNNPIVKINCAAIPDTLLESELFGYKMGAFTNADSDKEGKFQAAHTGTLVLDEIGDMDMDLQAKILRALEQQEVQRVGSTKTEKVDVRAIASTNQALEEMTRNGKFREDLYYRLAVFQIEVPALRDRFGDIPPLARHFVKQYAEWFDRPITGLTDDALAVLTTYDWPGNVRELRNCIEVAAVMADGDLIDVEALPPYLTGNQGSAKELAKAAQKSSLDETLTRIEKHILMDTLRKAGGVQAKAASMLGISERSMWHRVKKYEIPVGAVKSEA